MNMTAEERARALVDRNDHMTIATADLAGAPWVSPVFYVPDDDYDLYWMSAASARHSENIRANPRVAIVIFEEEPVADAVYIAARASQIDDSSEARQAAAILALKEQPQKWTVEYVADVTGDAPWRIYRAAVETIETRVERAERGKPIAARAVADFRRRR